MTKAAIDDFLAQKTLAVVGVSRRARGFGYGVFKHLKAGGYRVFAINPNAASIGGERCYTNLAALPEPVGGAVVLVPRAQMEQVVREAARAGIRRVWIQQFCETAAAIRFCEENGLSVISGQCILMFAEPVSFNHRVHRWLWKLIGKLPC